MYSNNKFRIICFGKKRVRLHVVAAVLMQWIQCLPPPSPHNKRLFWGQQAKHTFFLIHIELLSVSFDLIEKEQTRATTSCVIFILHPEI